MCVQWAEALALQGDEADGVPGVDRVGPMTAKRLLQKFGSIQGLQENAHKVSCCCAAESIVESSDLAYSG